MAELRAQRQNGEYMVTWSMFTGDAALVAKSRQALGQMSVAIKERFGSISLQLSAVAGKAQPTFYLLVC